MTHKPLLATSGGEEPAMRRKFTDGEFVSAISSLVLCQGFYLAMPARASREVGKYGEAGRCCESAVHRDAVQRFSRLIIIASSYTQLDQCVETERIDPDGLLAPPEIVQFSTKE